MNVAQVFRVALWLVCSLLLGARTVDAQSQQRLRVAYVAVSGTQAALWTAQEAGLFRKYALETDLVYIPGAAQVIQTMLAGDIQLAAAAPSGVVSVVLRGGDLVTVAGMVNIPGFYLAVRPEIKTIQDLRGLPVGVTRYGSSTDFTMRYLLRKAGLEPDKDVPVVQMGGQPELAAGIENRRIYAAPMVPPAIVKVLNLGGKILVTPQSIGFRFPHVGIVVRKSFLERQRDTVRNFLMGYSEGVALLHRDKERAKKALSRYVRSEDPELLEATWKYAIDTLERVPYPDPETFKVVLEERGRTDPEAARASPERFIDDSVVRELDRDGFFKKLYGR